NLILELAARFVEAHQHAVVFWLHDDFAVSYDGLAGHLVELGLNLFRITEALVVGTDDDSAAGHDGAAIGLGTEGLNPLDIGLVVNIPGGGKALDRGVDHVSRRRAAVHVPIAARLALRKYGVIAWVGPLVDAVDRKGDWDADGEQRDKRGEDAFQGGESSHIRNSVWNATSRHHFLFGVM